MQKYSVLKKPAENCRLFLFFVVSLAGVILFLGINSFSKKESGENGFIKLRTQKSISALSIMYEGNILWDFSAFDLEERNIEGALVGYSLFGNVIPEGEHIIGKYTGDISINNISLADPNANAISVKVSINKTITTNNEFLNSEDDTFIGIYDITGKKLNGIIDGINIIKYKKSLSFISGLLFCVTFLILNKNIYTDNWLVLAVLYFYHKHYLTMTKN